MGTSGVLRKPLWLVLISSLCTVGMWVYVRQVLIPHQKADAALHGRPRGNLSDLYPRWLGARELLLHGRNPYSAEITREIQHGYYGRALDPSRPEDPTDQQAFAYPVYITFYLAPTVRLPFDVVAKVFFWILLGLTAACVPLWLRVLGWPLPLWVQVCVVALALGSFVVLQGLKLQQMTLLVVALMALAMALLVGGHAISTGILLALATIKPQLVCPLLFWLGIWTLADWKRRYRWVVSFLITMAILFAASELLLPHWLARFWQAVREYQAYTGAMPLPDKLIPRPWSTLFEIAIGLGTIYVCWKNRKHDGRTPEFAVTVCLVLSVTLLVIPTYALYNQVLLLPALLLLARERQTIRERSRAGSVLLLVVAFFLSWQWLASTVLAVAYLLISPEVVQKAWAFPTLTAFTLPISVAGLMLLVAIRGTFNTSGSRVTA
jgi:hypothetical protein